MGKAGKRLKAIIRSRANARRTKRNREGFAPPGFVLMSHGRRDQTLRALLLRMKAMEAAPMPMSSMLAGSGVATGPLSTSKL